MTFKTRVFDEPVLEFGDGGQHCDPRQGLREFGPLQPRSGDVVLVGVILMKPAAALGARISS
jgi:hypothetical protein